MLQGASMELFWKTTRVAWLFHYVWSSFQNWLQYFYLNLRPWWGERLPPHESKNSFILWQAEKVRKTQNCLLTFDLIGCAFDIGRSCLDSRQFALLAFSMLFLIWERFSCLVTCCLTMLDLPFARFETSIRRGFSGARQWLCIKYHQTIQCLAKHLGQTTWYYNMQSTYLIIFAAG